MRPTTNLSSKCTKFKDDFENGGDFLQNVHSDQIFVNIRLTLTLLSDKLTENDLAPITKATFYRIFGG